MQKFLEAKDFYELKSYEIFADVRLSLNRPQMTCGVDAQRRVSRYSMSRGLS